MHDTVNIMLIAICSPLIYLMDGFIFTRLDLAMSETGQLANSALKLILFRKNLRMTNATNKDFTMAEINQIISSGTECVWETIK